MLLILLLLFSLSVFADTTYITGNRIGPTIEMQSGVLDCQPPGQKFKGELRTTSVGPVISINDMSDVTIRNCDIRGNVNNLNQTVGIRIVARSSNKGNINIINNVLENPYATSATPHTCISVGAVPPYVVTNLTISGNVAHDCGNGNKLQNSDGITVNNAGTGLRIDSNISYKNNTDGIDIASGMSPEIVNNLVFNNGFDGIKMHCGGGKLTGLLFSGNISLGNKMYAYTLQDFSNSKIDKNTGIQSNGDLAAIYYANPNKVNCIQERNVISNNYLESNSTFGPIHFEEGSRQSFESQNSINGNMYKSNVGSGIIFFEKDYTNSVTKSNFDTWRVQHPKEVISQ